MKTDVDVKNVGHGAKISWIWPVVLLSWFVLISWLPDPRPLGAPELAVQVVQKVSGASVQVSGLVATGILRGTGLALIGVLMIPALGRVRRSVAIPAALVMAPVLAVLSLWINYTFFPLNFQVLVAVSAAVMGVILGLSFYKIRWALPALILFPVALFAWGTSTGVSDDFFEVAQEAGLYILESADEVPSGDAGFEKLMELAFAFAEDNSHRRDPVLANRAAILALGVILGEEKVATVAKREISLAGIAEAKKLRSRITAYGRHDLPRHFWVSAGLAVISDSEASMAVGIAKEMMDSAGGSGFSFVDLTADRAGTLFCIAATRDEDSARAMQRMIRNGATLEDYMPNALDLPEGITNVDFKNKYGGLGGARTNELVEEIIERLAGCRALL